MWIYRQKTGDLFHNSTKVADGYSGFGPGKNAPEQQSVVNVGPIPCGAYNIGAEAEPDPLSMNRHGPLALHLVPTTGTQTFGRSGFLIHGDSAEHPGQASHGCIILQREVRKQIAESHDRLLVVLPELP